MKQLLFLLLFPCLALAQYQGNANQKITLGEQTTADGLVYRGRLADTANLLTNKLDTSVYIVLDTGTRAMWYYRASTTPKWTRLVDSLNNLQGTLSVAKGGTGSATQNFVDLTTTQSIGGDKTFTSAVTATRFNPTGTSATGNGMYLPSANTLGFSTNGTNKLIILSNGNVGINNTSPAEKLDVNGTIYNNAGGVQLPRQFRNDFTPNVERADLMFLGNQTSNNGFRWGTIASAGGTTFQSTQFNDSGLKTNISLNPDGGNVGIGTTSPQSGYKLHVVDSVYVGGRVSAAGYTTRSDYNLKDEIQILNYGLKEVIQLQPVKYTYKSNGEQQLGFIAQDIGTIIPESVHFDEFMGVDYQSIIPILTKAIQEQNLLIKALEQRILILENK